MGPHRGQFLPLPYSSGIKGLISSGNCLSFCMKSCAFGSPVLYRLMSLLVFFSVDDTILESSCGPD